jgi:hypothetical protein
VVPVIGGHLALGTWQSVVLLDPNLDNPERRVRFIIGRLASAVLGRLAPASVPSVVWHPRPHPRSFGTRVRRRTILAAASVAGRLAPRRGAAGAK